MGDYCYIGYINKDFIYMNGDGLIFIVFRLLGNIIYVVVVFFICFIFFYSLCREVVVWVAVDLFGDDLISRVISRE